MVEKNRLVLVLCVVLFLMVPRPYFPLSATLRATEPGSKHKKPGIGSQYRLQIMREGIKGKRGEVGEERRGDMRSGEQPHIMSGLQAAVHREKDSSLLRARAKYKRRDRFWRLCTGPRTAGSLSSRGNLAKARFL